MKPCLTAFMADRALPCSVRGPVDIRALARLPIGVAGGYSGNERLPGRAAFINIADDLPALLACWQRLRQ